MRKKKNTPSLENPPLLVSVDYVDTLVGGVFSIPKIARLKNTYFDGNTITNIHSAYIN